jgi:hypothetical protein
MLIVLGYANSKVVDTRGNSLKFGKKNTSGNLKQNTLPRK